MDPAGHARRLLSPGEHRSQQGFVDTVYKVALTLSHLGSSKPEALRVYKQSPSFGDFSALSFINYCWGRHILNKCSLLLRENDLRWAPGPSLPRGQFTALEVQCPEEYWESAREVVQPEEGWGHRPAAATPMVQMEPGKKSLPY